MTIFHHRFSIGKKQEQVVAIRVQPPQPQTVKERQVIPKLARLGKVTVKWEIKDLPISEMIFACV